MGSGKRQCGPTGGREEEGREEKKSETEGRKRMPVTRSGTWRAVLKRTEIVTRRYYSYLPLYSSYVSNPDSRLPGTAEGCGGPAPATVPRPGAAITVRY
eukprot:753661-Hanusia_phi.AAC.1